MGFAVFLSLNILGEHNMIELFGLPCLPFLTIT